MNKLFATLLLFIVSLNLLGQDGYIKYNTDSSYRSKAIKVFKGEILPYFNSTKANKINILIGKDTINDVSLQSKIYTAIQAPDTFYQSQKETLVQLKMGGLVLVRANKIPTTDTVTLIAESGKQLTQLIDKREAQVNQLDCGKIFRLIITNAPSIFYVSDKLTPFVEPAQLEESGTTTTKQEPAAGWAWWYYILLVLAVCGIGFGIWKFMKRKKKNSDEYVRFNGGSLSDFAKPYGGLDFLSSINDKGVIPTKNEWDKMKSKGESITKIQNLTGEKVRIKKESKSEFSIGEVNTKSEEKENTYKWDTPKETYVQPTNFGNNNELSSQLRQMEDKLIREIQRVSSGNNSNELSKLRNEKTELENKIKGLESDKRNFDSALVQLQSDKSTLEKSVQNANDEKNRIQNEIKELKEKVIAVEFLKGYSESVFSYLKYCQKVSNEAIIYFNKISQQNPKQGFVAGHFLMKFQNSVNLIPVGDWLRTVEDIKDSGSTTNRQLTRSFVLIQNDNDKIKEFQRLLFSDVLIKYSSNLLILAESFKNLSHFQASADFTNEALSTFGKHVTEIVSRAKLAGLELKYVSLFESWEKYEGQVEDHGVERSLAYKEISSLQKGAIAEIVSYGVKTPLGDDTKTIVILA